MFQADENGIYAVVQASPVRRIFAYGVQFGLGALVIYTTLVEPPAVLWMIFMLVFGVLMLFTIIYVLLVMRGDKTAEGDE